MKTIICKVCGKEFQTLGKGSGTIKYCSDECKKIGYRLNRIRFRHTDKYKKTKKQYNHSEKGKESYLRFSIKNFIGNAEDVNTIADSLIKETNKMVPILELSNGKKIYITGNSITQKEATETCKSLINIFCKQFTKENTTIVKKILDEVI